MTLRRLAACLTILSQAACQSVAIPPAPSASPADAEGRVETILSGMTLEQKIGQMTQPDIRSVTPDDVRAYALGSILNGGGAWPNQDKHASVEDWRKLAARYRSASLASDLPIKVPVLWGTDAVHGHNNVYGATLFPHNIGLGAAHDPALMRAIGRATAAQVRATGIDWAFAPTLAVVQNPRWGRSYESYSSDPMLVRAYGEAMVQGLQGRLGANDSVLGTAKHFIGDGGTFHGKDQGETRTSLANLLATHGAGYRGALDADVQTVMVSYSSFTDVVSGKAWGKMHGNAYLINDVLKGEMGFKGLVVSDWNAIEQVDGCTRTRCPQAINAGIDLVMVPDDWKQFIANTVADVKSGAIPMARIDDAVRRILRVKLRAGLFDERPLPDASVMSSPEVRALARQAVRESLVLLKNRGAALPLGRETRILVVGKGADSVPMQSGGWSLTWQGDNTDNRDYPNAETLLAALRRELGTAQVDYSLDGKGVDVARYGAIVNVAAEMPYAEMKGDVTFPAPLRHSARFPEDLAALERVAGKGVPVVTLLYSGRPVAANDLIARSDAFVAAWLPGTEGAGLADMILAPRAGEAGHDFVGRLSFDWPAGDCLGANGPWLYRRGAGLGLGDKGPSADGGAIAAPDQKALSCPADSF